MMEKEGHNMSKFSYKEVKQAEKFMSNRNPHMYTSTGFGRKYSGFVSKNAGSKKRSKHRGGKKASSPKKQNPAESQERNKEISRAF